MNGPEEPGYRPYEPPPGPGAPEPGHPYGQQLPYGQAQPYGQQHPWAAVDPHGRPLPGAVPFGIAPPDHPQATTVLVLGVLGLVTCQLISPFAWGMGQRVVREIDASGGRVGGRSAANAGRVCGIVGTILVLLAVLVVVGALTVGVLAA